MRGVADALGPLRRFQAEVGALCGVGIIPDLGHDAIVLPQDRYPSLQFGDSDVIARNVGRRRHTQITLKHFDQIAVCVPVFNAATLAVAYDQQRFGTTRIYRETMTAVKLSFLRRIPARSAEGLDVLAV